MRRTSLLHRRVGGFHCLHDFMGKEAAGQNRKDLVVPHTQPEHRVAVPHLSLSLTQAPQMAQTSATALFSQLLQPSHCTPLEHEFVVLSKSCDILSLRITAGQKPMRHGSICAYLLPMGSTHQVLSIQQGKKSKAQSSSATSSRSLNQEG